MQRAAAAPAFTGATPANNAVLVASVVATPEGFGQLFAIFRVEAKYLSHLAVYRQYVKGWYKVNGADFPQHTGSDKTGPKLSGLVWQEDGTKGNGAYGHRDDMDELSYYHPPGNQSYNNALKEETSFFCEDQPGIETDSLAETEIEFYLEFQGKLLNAALSMTHETRSWVVKGHARKVGGVWTDVP